MAKCAMYYIDNHKIEVVNTIFGKEKILLNGRIVSEKTADIGTAHTFTIGRNEYKISQRDKTYDKKGSIFEVRKNGMPLSLVNLLPQSSIQLLILVVIMGLCFGFSVGLFFYSWFWPVVEV